MLREYNITPRSVGTFTIRELHAIVVDHNEQLRALADG